MSPREAKPRIFTTAGAAEADLLTDEDLLKARMCDLGLRIEASELMPLVSQLYQELENRGLVFRPKVYLGDEWFSPEGVNAIAVPFYLAHPRLKTLEKKMMLEVEGGTPEWFMRLIRHEAGHCFDHAYHFSKRRKWRTTFGSPDQHYDPDSYRPMPYSRSFVRNIENYYAQSHPDEDFAETFAVWLSPDHDWREKYARWPIALRKLEYIESLAREVSGKPPLVKGGSVMSAASRLKSTLGAYYVRRRKERAQDYPDFFDSALKAIFNGPADAANELSAEKFLRRHRKFLIDRVPAWTNERKYTIDELIGKFAQRSRELGLSLGKTEADTCLEFSTYLSTQVTHRLFTGRFRRSLSR